MLAGALILWGLVAGLPGMASPSRAAALAVRAARGIGGLQAPGVGQGVPRVTGWIHVASNYQGQWPATGFSTAASTYRLLFMIRWWPFQPNGNSQASNRLLVTAQHVQAAMNKVAMK